MGEPIVVTCEQCDGLGVAPKPLVPGTYLVVCEHQIVPQECPYCELKRLRTELESERVAHNQFAVAMENRALDAEVQRDELLDALKAVVYEYGPWHDDDCPCDDTCDCSAKPIHDAINSAVAKAKGK